MESNVVLMILDNKWLLTLDYLSFEKIEASKYPTQLNFIFLGYFKSIIYFDS